MIDWARIEELKAEVGDEDLHEVFDLFLEEVRSVLDGLTPDDPAALRRDLHFLKGSALNIGMTEVGALCAEFETRLRADPASGVDAAAVRAAVDRASAVFGQGLRPDAGPG